MNTPKLIWMLLLLAILAQLGCSKITENLRGKHSKPVESISIQVWLNDPIKFPLTSKSLQLPQALEQPLVNDNRAVLEQATEVLKRRSNPFQFEFDDDCIVLARGEHRWYFLEPLGLLELYAGQVEVKSDDVIFTMPFRKSRFVTHPFQKEAAYVLIEAGKPPAIKKFEPGASERSIQHYFINYSTTGLWTVSCITRQDQQGIHHLVLPAVNLNIPSPKGSSDFSEKLSIESTDSQGVFFLPGDMVEQLTAGEFLAKL